MKKILSFFTILSFASMASAMFTSFDYCNRFANNATLEDIRKSWVEGTREHQMALLCSEFHLWIECNKNPLMQSKYVCQGKVYKYPDADEGTARREVEQNLAPLSKRFLEFILQRTSTQRESSEHQNRDFNIVIKPHLNRPRL